MPSVIGEHAGPGGQVVYSVEEAAKLLGIGRTLMYQLVTSGEIDSFKIGRKRRVPGGAIDGYIKRLRAGQSPSPSQRPSRPRIG